VSGPGPAPEAAHPAAADDGLPYAQVQRRRPFMFIWLVPLVALGIAGYLGFHAVARRGEEIVITFSTADGLTAGQTKVRHKAVDLGTVERINLSRDMSKVVLHVQMEREADRILTSNARFWVVRPRLTAGSISGLDTLISGSFIEVDPGPVDAPGKPQEAFVGLEEPPAVRSDEPGRTFTLTAGRIGSLASGSPVFFHDIEAGEVLGYDLVDNGQAVAIHTFIRKPYDDYVREDTRFWNSSGIALNLGAQGFKVQVQSLQAVLSGGVSFDRPTEGAEPPPAREGATFPLFSDEAAANAASYRTRLKFTTYVEGSVSGLAVDAPVQLYGIQIGNVTGVKLELDPVKLTSRVRIDFEIQPERIMRPDELKLSSLDVARGLVARGMRAQLQSASLITGQQLLAMAFIPNAPPAEARQQGDTIVIPSQPASSLDSITNGLSSIAAKLGSLPLDQIAANLSSALGGVARLTNGPEMQQTLKSLAGTVTDAQELVRKVDAGMTPALKRLPEIATSLQATADHASHLLSSVDTGYGGNSEFNRNLQRVLAQVSDTARSVRLLADFLDQHPEALIRGRSGDR
jgi:paraquat-inducible protein B